MKTTMLYYVAERIDSEKHGHLTNLIKRCDTLAEAQGYIKEKADSWQNEGLTVIVEPWSAEGRTPWAYNPEYGEKTCTVKHMLFIFATPIFMAGGTEGL